MTTGQLVTAVIDKYVNAGGRSANRPALRGRAEFALRALAHKAFMYRWPWRYTAGTVTVAAYNPLASDPTTDGSGLLPADFSSVGDNFTVYVNGTSQELRPMNMDRAFRRRQIVGGTGSPLWYTLRGQTVAGRKRIFVEPKPASTTTLLLQNYLKKAPTLVDFPAEPTVAVGSAGALTGVYQWLLTFATADGETEAGYSSTALTLASQRASLYGLAVPTTPDVTARYLYRTNAGGAVFYRHPVTLDLTTAYTAAAPLEDNTADASLSATVTPPDPVDAVTGLEQIPSDWHESLMFDGLVARMMESQGDMRKESKDGEFMRGLAEMWKNERADQMRGKRLPRYGASAYRL